MQQLTPRETDVVRSLLRGNIRNMDIGNDIVAGERTVQHHLTQIFRKTGASCKTELVLMTLGVKPVDISLPKLDDNSHLTDD